MDETVGNAGAFRRATAAYLAALAIIAVIAIVSHVLVDAIVEQQSDTARVVNLAGRQRMLSQRIASLAEQLAFPDGGNPGATLEPEMQDAVKKMAESHEMLAALPMTLGSAEQTELDLRVHAYLGLAQDFLAMPPAMRSETRLLGALLAEAHRPILDSLDAAVGRYQAASEASVARLRWTLGGMLAVMLATLAAEAVLIFRPLFRRLRRAQRLLLDAALTDPLTGCRNRRYLMELATHEADRARRSGRPLAVLMIDIDRFKIVNDTWGHANGDRAILALAETAVACLRGGDAVGRIGGEEFAAVLPDTDLAGGIAAAEKLRQRVEGIVVPVQDGSFGFTISVGVAVFSVDDGAVAAAFERADQALYTAKNRGRNRVEGWRPEFVHAHGGAAEVLGYIGA